MDRPNVTYINNLWEKSVIPTLIDYIKIPNKSPAFDPQWQAHGHMEQAVSLFKEWALQQPIAEIQLEIVRLPAKTPLLLIEIAGDSPGEILLYGHLDKQPEMVGWRPDLGPWKPVLYEDKLYGRGSADDGYALFSALTAIASLQKQQIPHPRCVILIEACEESGSYDLPPYIDYLRERIGNPELIIALDSGCGNYDQLWSTTSLRGLIGGTLSVEMLTEGVHSGDASGIVPDTFRIVRQLLSRIEDEITGAIIHPDFISEIPLQRITQAQSAADNLGKAVYEKFPFVSEACPTTSDLTELILNRTWRPALSVIGCDDIPPIQNAGNVLRPKTQVKLSLRLPPTCESSQASRALQNILETNPPNQANISFTPDWAATGWNAPELVPWLGQCLQQTSMQYFGKPAMYMGEGGTIPFMAMLGEKFPQAQFLITGVLGPHSNAHGPNEFLHLPTAKKISCCIADVIAEFVHHTTRSESC